MFTRLGNVFQNHKLGNIKYMKDETRHDSKKMQKIITEEGC